MTSDNMIEQLRKLGELRDSGVLTGEEFAEQKARILGADTGAERSEANTLGTGSVWKQPPAQVPPSATGGRGWWFVVVPLAPIIALVGWIGHGGSSPQRISKSDLEQSVQIKATGSQIDSNDVANGYVAELPSDVNCVKGDDDGAHWTCLVSFDKGVDQSIDVTVDSDGSWVSS